MKPRIAPRECGGTGGLLRWSPQFSMWFHSTGDFNTETRCTDPVPLKDRKDKRK